MEDRPCSRSLSWAAPSPGPHPLLGRTLSWAALTSLISLALCASPAAQAQGTQADTYTIAYSGGATTAIGSTDFPTGPYTLASAPNQHVPAGNAYGGSASNHQIFSGNSVTVNCKGSVTATFTWYGGPNNDPAPVVGSVIVVDQVNAGCNGQTGSVGSDLPGGTTSGSSASQTYTATRYSVKGGGSFTATCTPTASASSTAPPGGYSGVSAYVGYTAAVYPVTVTPVGAVQDQSGNWDILIGQKCGPILAGIPSGCTVSNYQWTVSGSTFQTWTADNSSTAFTDGPGPLNGPSPPNVVPIVAGPSWYWYDAGNNTHVAETVSCTVTVTPPAGQGSAVSVTPSQTVNVYIPSWTATGAAGTMRVSTSIPNVGNGSSYWLWAGGPGMAWQASVSSPLSGVFGTGTIELVQTYTPGISYTTADGMVHNYSLNGQNGLDTSYPYVGGTSSFNDYDDPGLNLTATAAISGSLQDQFQDCLMYEPQGSSQFVPLANSSWTTSGSAQIPATGWANFSGSAGTVSGGSFSQNNTFPSWTQNVGNGTGHF